MWQRRRACRHDAGHVHDAHCSHTINPIHDEEIKSISLTSEKPIDGVRFTQWLDKLLAEKGQDILRAKGILMMRESGFEAPVDEVTRSDQPSRRP